MSLEDININGKSYDTVCVMDIQCFNGGVASEQFVDANGKLFFEGDLTRSIGPLTSLAESFGARTCRIMNR